MHTNVSLRPESVNPATVGKDVPGAKTAAVAETPARRRTAVERRYRSPMRLNISSIVA